MRDSRPLVADTWWSWDGHRWNRFFPLRDQHGRVHPFSCSDGYVHRGRKPTWRGPVVVVLWGSRDAA